MKTLIVDDERLARKELISLLAAEPDVEITGECANADEALSAIATDMPDLIFLDIQMPGKNGFELLEQLDAAPEVIFVTAYDDYALKAFEVSALDYLLKPIDERRLAEALRKVRQRWAGHRPTPEGEALLQPDDRIFLKDGEKCWFVTLRDIRYFESEGNYVSVVFKDKKPLVLKSLNNLEKRLDEKQFFRINRRFIVNLNFIEHVEPWFNGGMQIKLTCGTDLEVSRRQSARFRDLLSL